MKKHILKLLALALCAVSLLNLTALAEEAVSPEEADTEKTTAEDELPAAPAAQAGDRPKRPPLSWRWLPG